MLSRSADAIDASRLKLTTQSFFRLPRFSQPRINYMKTPISLFLGTFALIATGLGPVDRSALGNDAIIEEVASMEEAFTKAFNEANTDEVVGMFLPEAELVDDSGNVFQGKQALQEVFSGYFANFPGARLALRIESIRSIGENLAIEEGTRFLTTADEAMAQVRYTATLTKQDGKWRLASIREFYDEPLPTPEMHLQSLAWLVGDWVSEGVDMSVRVAYRWDEGRNFLLGKYLVTRDGEVIMQSDQRVAFDPLTGGFRSWLFDSDGGVTEGRWTLVEDSWVIKSQAVEPTGGVGTATVTFTQLDKDRFQMIGTDRIIGDERAPDFDATVTRAPPRPLAREKAAPISATGTETTAAQATAPAKPPAPVPNTPAPQKAPAQAPR